MYPKLEININGIVQNMLQVKELCEKRRIELSLVTKGLGGNLEVVRALVEAGVNRICDAHVQNLKTFKDLNVEKVYLREPSISDVSGVITYSDISMNSEIVTLRALNEEAEKQGKIHKVILMYELGDLREGANREELELLIEETKKLDNIELYGLGANLSCYGAIMPSEDNMKDLENTAMELEKKHDIKFKIISGGNSTSYDMLVNGELPDRINDLRIGELILLGNIPCVEKRAPQLNYNNFTLKAQIVEIKEKPSVPWGIVGGVNSFGEIPETGENRGNRIRAILAIGKQDVGIKEIKPDDDKVLILDGSSDYFILDITDSERNYSVGDIVSFKPTYGAMLHLMTSTYVEKEII